MTLNSVRYSAAVPLPAHAQCGKSEQLEWQPHRRGGAGSASNGYHTAPLSSLARSSQYASQADEAEEDEDEAGDGGGGWHVAVLPSGLSLSEPTAARPSSLAAFMSLLSVAFNAIKRNIVRRTPHTALPSSDRAPFDTRSPAQACLPLGLLCAAAPLASDSWRGSAVLRCAPARAVLLVERSGRSLPVGS